jgi:hypothetical protein
MAFHNYEYQGDRIHPAPNTNNQVMIVTGGNAIPVPQSYYSAPQPYYSAPPQPYYSTAYPQGGNIYPIQNNITPANQPNSSKAHPADNYYIPQIVPAHAENSTKNTKLKTPNEPAVIAAFGNYPYFLFAMTQCCGSDPHYSQYVSNVPCGTVSELDQIMGFPSIGEIERECCTCSPTYALSCKPQDKKLDYATSVFSCGCGICPSLTVTANNATNSIPLGTIEVVRPINCWVKTYLDIKDSSGNIILTSRIDCSCTILCCVGLCCCLTFFCKSKGCNCCCDCDTLGRVLIYQLYSPYNHSVICSYYEVKLLLILLVNKTLSLL